MRTVFCAKLKKEGPGLVRQPIPGPLGERIFDEISEEAWGMWLSYQTMLINEYRLSLIDQKAREYLLQQMEKYFFSQDIMETPSDYRPIEE